MANFKLSARPFTDPIITTADIFLAAPDIIGITLVDDVFFGNIITSGTQFGASWTTTTAVNPLTGNTETGSIIGPDRKALRFADRPVFYWDRMSLQDASKYTVTGKTVDACYRYTRHWASPRFTGESVGTPPADNTIYLKLNSALVQGTSYTVHRTDDYFEDITFTYNDRYTRAQAIRSNMNGYRPHDAKMAYLCHRIAEYNSGVIDFSDYAMGAGTAFHVIDSTTKAIVYNGTIRLRRTPAQFDLDATPSHTNYLADLTQPLAISSVSTTGSPTIITFGSAHGLSVDDVIRCFGCQKSGNLTHGLENGGRQGANPCFIVVDVPSSTTAEVEILNPASAPFDTQTAFSNTNALVAAQYDSSLGGVSNTAYVCYQTNGSGTYSYGLEFDNLREPGRYQIYIPGYGVSDEFVVDEAAHAQSAAIFHKGMYSQRIGDIDISVYSNLPRGPCLANGVGNIHNYISGMLPSVSVEASGTNHAATAGLTAIPSGLGAYANSVTNSGFRGQNSGVTTNARGGHQDAGDNDDLLNDHWPLWIMPIELLVYMENASMMHSFNFPTQLSSDVCDNTIFTAATDDMPPLFHEVAWYLEAYRPTQHVDGYVHGGLGVGHFNGQVANFPEPIDYYRGTDINSIATGNGDVGGHIYAADHSTNFGWAALAAQFSYVCHINGLTDARDAYRTSAEAAYAWADSLLGDSVAQDTYYNNLSPEGLQSYMNTDATGFSNLMSAIDTTAESYKLIAAQFLCRLTHAIDGTIDTTYGTYLAGQALGTFGGGTWEGLAYFLTPGHDASHENYIINGGRFLVSDRTTQVVSDNSSFAHAGGRNYGVSTNILYHIFNRVWQDQTYLQLKDSIYLKTLVREMDALLGASQLGYSLTPGIGPRQIKGYLHEDAEKHAVNVVHGIAPYTYFVPFSGGGFAGLATSLDNASNWCAENTTGDFEATRGSKKMEWPWRMATSLYEWAPQGRWGATLQSEFDISTCTIQWLCASLYVHGWDGNTETALTV